MAEKTVEVRYLGPKKVKYLDLPLGVTSKGDITSSVQFSPIGELPVHEAHRLFDIPGARENFIYESQYQKQLKAKELLEELEGTSDDVSSDEDNSSYDGASSSEASSPDEEDRVARPFFEVVVKE